MKRSRPRRSRRWRRSSRVNVDIVPLVDVMFLLLCFFILMTLSMVVQHGIFVDLAPAKSGQSVQTSEQPVVVSVQADGSLHLNKQPVSRSALAARLESLARQRDSLRVVLNADETASHGDVIRALDTIRQNDVDNVVFTVTTPDS